MLGNFLFRVFRIAMYFIIPIVLVGCNGGITIGGAKYRDRRPPVGNKQYIRAQEFALQSKSEEPKISDNNDDTKEDVTKEFYGPYEEYQDMPSPREVYIDNSTLKSDKYREETKDSKFVTPKKKYVVRSKKQNKNLNKKRINIINTRETEVSTGKKINNSAQVYVGKKISQTSKIENQSPVAKISVNTNNNANKNIKNTNIKTNDNASKGVQNISASLYKSKQKTSSVKSTVIEDDTSTNIGSYKTTFTNKTPAVMVDESQNASSKMYETKKQLISKKNSSGIANMPARYYSPEVHKSDLNQKKSQAKLLSQKSKNLRKEGKKSFVKPTGISEKTLKNPFPADVNPIVVSKKKSINIKDKLHELVKATKKSKVSPTDFDPADEVSKSQPSIGTPQTQDRSVASKPSGDNLMSDDLSKSIGFSDDKKSKTSSKSSNDQKVGDLHAADDEMQNSNPEIYSTKNKPMPLPY